MNTLKQHSFFLLLSALTFLTCSSPRQSAVKIESTDETPQKLSFSTSPKELKLHVLPQVNCFISTFEGPDAPALGLGICESIEKQDTKYSLKIVNFRDGVAKVPCFVSAEIEPGNDFRIIVEKDDVEIPFAGSVSKKTNFQTELCTIEPEGSLETSVKIDWNNWNIPNGTDVKMKFQLTVEKKIDAEKSWNGTMESPSISAIVKN